MSRDIEHGGFVEDRSIRDQGHGALIHAVCPVDDEVELGGRCPQFDWVGRHVTESQ
ncbi:hypothetical protein EV641_12444 [Rhodococcus sp. SMB37]|uniref:hypothetical protein n=1 Tax=Rhodococcus sp. SMB37 TaxID=2512213 RepID=UPI0010EF54B6|nr:hypothetical protein [Rhodococcus sp. SMB37]TCN45141.1 hypothetical protein EV641_12444 [Rhodococcus sp. SMB37]